MSAPRHSLRKAVLLRAKRGDYASAGEIAIAAGVSRQTANRWLQEAGIDLAAARLKYLAKLYQFGQEYIAALSGAPRLTDQQRRRQVIEAVKKLNEAQTKRASTKH